MMPRAAVYGVIALLATGCIWNPTNRTEREKGANFVVSGYTTTPNDTVNVWVRNNNTTQWESLGSAVSAADEAYVGSSLYAWSFNATTATGFSASSTRWAPTGLGPLSSTAGPPGRVELYAADSNNVPFYTFTNQAKSCFYSNMGDPSTYQDTGADCHDGDKLVQFDNTGVATTYVDPSNLLDVLPYGAAAATTPVAARWDVVKYKSQGLDVYGIVCRPNDNGSYPVHILNHGGGGGLGNGDLTMCMDFARNGWITAMSAYRGEPVTLTQTTGGKYPVPSTVTLTSGGLIEVCLGEVTDVVRMLKVVQAKYNTVANQVLMTGFSHGGCITTRAVQQGAPVQMAIDAFGPGDWAATYTSCTYNVNGFCDDVREMLRDATGDAPNTATERAYQWRSPGYRDANSALFPGDLGGRTDVKFMIQHGTVDNIVTAGQSCKLAADAWGANTSNSFFVLPSGATTASPSASLVPAGCPTTWSSAARPSAPTTWGSQRYLMMYQGVSHAISNELARDYYKFIESKGWKPAFVF